jgi:amidophosphoribosyltransferase
MCGIFGVFNVRKAAELTAIGLHHIQHRASDFAGIVSTDGEYLYQEHGPGLVTEVFSSKEMLDGLHGLTALGHIRYPTVSSDGKKRDNIQPITGFYDKTEIAIAHNGNLTNRADLKALMPDRAFTTDMDTEDILRLLQEVETGDIEADLITVLKQLKGSFTLGILLPDCLIAIQDPSDCHPLSIGRLGGGYCLSSETCSLPSVDADFVCDVEPGTMVFITNEGLRTVRFAEPKPKRCVFEQIYFSHPASDTFRKPVALFRMQLGRALEVCAPVPGADIVVQVPDSSNFIALGYAESGRSGTYFPTLFRHHNIGRSFIVATQAGRDAKVDLKFTFGRSLIEGKKIVLVDDSIVRGTTMRNMVRRFFRLGASEVHVRIGAPPIRHPCTYGINTPTHNELKSAQISPSELCAEIGATSLEFLPLEVLQSLSAEPGSMCYACMNGEYW